MATLGEMEFAGRSAAFDCAAAFYLTKMPKRAVIYSTADIVVEARPNHPHVVVRFRGAGNAGESLSRGNEAVQEGLDMISIRGDADLVVRDTAEEHLLSWREQGAQIARAATTFLYEFDSPPVTLIVRDAAGSIVQENQPQPEHHLAFRYFRLSQAADDLFEAYRNMYLAFELLLSAAVPMQHRERERTWLQRGIATLDAQLNLRRFVRNPTADVAEDFIARVYTSARLPLFHAKHGRTDSLRRKILQSDRPYWMRWIC